MRLIKVKNEDIQRAVGMYILAEEWTPFSHLGISEQAAFDALSSPNSFWRFLVDDSDKVIGLCGLEKINPLDKVAEPFIALIPAKQNSGLGLEAMTLIFDVAKRDLGFRRLQTTVLTDSPSRPFLEKLGATCEGILRKLRFKNGEYVDALLYAWVDDKEQ